MTNVLLLKSDFDMQIDRNENNLELKIHEMRELLNQNNNFQLPHVVKTECFRILEDITKDINDKSKALK